MSTHSIIIEEIRRVAAEHKRTLGPLDDDAPLIACGLDSLGFAVLVARLEEILGVDPFISAEDASLPVTMGDLVRFYGRVDA